MRITRVEGREDVEMMNRKAYGIVRIGTYELLNSN